LLLLVILGPFVCLSFASTFGVIALTFPALDNDPCDGIISPPPSSNLLFFDGTQKRW
jgi:hypothetical protein